MQAFIGQAPFGPAVGDFDEQVPGLVALAAALFAQGPLKEQLFGDRLIADIFRRRLSETAIACGKSASDFSDRPFHNAASAAYFSVLAALSNCAAAFWIVVQLITAKIPD